MSRAQIHVQNAPLEKFGRVIQGIARGTQIIFGGIIAIILGVQLGKAQHYKAGWHHFWAFSCFMAATSTLTAMALCINRVKSYCYFIADGFFTTMWAVIAVIFGTVYFPFPKQELPLDKDTTGPSLPAMRAVAVLDLMVLMAWSWTLGMAWRHFVNVKKAVKDGRLA